MTLHPIYGAQIKMKKVEKQLHTYQMNTLLKQDSNERKTVLKKSVTDMFIQQKNSYCLPKQC